MNVIYRIQNGNASLTLSFSRSEAQKISKIMQKLGLQKRKIYNLWGEGIEAMAYIDTENRLLNDYLADAIVNHASHLHFINDLNKGFLYKDNGNYYLNLAFLRLIDEENPEITVKLNFLFTKLDFNELVKILTKIYEVVMNLLDDEVKATIVKIKAKINHNEVEN